MIDQLGDEWRALCEAGPYSDPFYRPEWIAAYVRAFAQRQTVAIATARCGGRLVAVLPLIRETGLIGGMPARKLRGAANVHTCRYDLIHHAGVSDVAIPAVWDALRWTPGWDVLELPNVPIRGALGRLARHAQAQGNATYAVRAATSPYVALPVGEAAFERLLQRVDVKFRSNLRRRMRKLEVHGSVKLVSTSKADARLAEFYELECSGWKGAGQSAIVCDTPTRSFYDEVAKQAERFGYLSIYALECAGRAVAMYYGLRQGSRYFLLKTAYDEGLRDCSPGQLITHEVLRDLATAGCLQLDFLGEMMDWKGDWAPQVRPHANWYVFRGPAGRLLHHLRFRVRPAIGRTFRAWRRSSSASVSPAPSITNERAIHL